ncbi:MAG TPA: glycosyltransferase family 39 protein [Candidatus Hydrogenedentes bacterium]|nr:glycosyltransferase family 39 protein [Candidatus Hydrogenedentota bacterium]
MPASDISSNEDARGLLRHWAVLVLIMVLAAVLRCYRLGEESLWNDETASILYMDAGSLRQFIVQERLDDPAMAPLYFTLEYFCWHATGGSILACRFMSIGFGLGAIVMLFLMARRLFGPFAALVAAGCAAVAIQQVYYSQEIRMYAPYLFFAMAAMYALHRILDGGRPVWWFVHALANAAMVWTHVYGIWLVFVQGLFFLAFRRKDFRSLLCWGAIHGPIVVSIALWVATMDQARIERNLAWIPGPRSETASQYLSESALSLPGTRPAQDLPLRLDETLRLPLASKVLIGTGWVALPVCAGIATLRARRELLRAKRKEEARRKMRDFMLAFVWLAAPALILLFLTLVWRPTFLPRYVFPSTLALYMLLGAGLAAVPGRRLRTVCAIAFIALYAYDTLSFGMPRRPDMRRAMDVVTRQPFEENGQLLVHPPGYTGPAKFYSQLPDAALVRMPEWREIPEKVDALAREGRPVWIVIGALQGVPPDVGPLLEEGGHAFDYHYFPGMFPVRLYHVPVHMH